MLRFAQKDVMKRLLVTLIFLVSVVVTAQNESSYWYFGQNAGLRFDSQTGNVEAITDGQINTLEGCTSISDSDGNLLFYSDGITVWNRNHQIMLNGTSLKGDPSSTSSGVIVPKPQDPNFYYIFTVDEPHHFNTSSFPNEVDGDGINDGLMYSQVNMLDDNGLGAVDNTLKNVQLVTYDQTNPLATELKCSEKITAVKADDCFSFWVITHFGDTFYAFKIDDNGVDPNPVTSTVGPYIPLEGYRRNALGYLKASPDGSKLVIANFGESTTLSGDAGGSIVLFDFDNDTGIVSNPLELYSAQNNNSPYGVEFSAENRKVYATIGIGPAGNGASQLLQWDLEAFDIPSTATVVHTSNSLSAGALQLGIDRRIYRAQVDFSNFNNSGQYIGIIENPEDDGPNVIYNEQGILLNIGGPPNNLSRIGLPPFIQSLFNSQVDIIKNGESTTELSLCVGDSYTLRADDIPGADYAWTKDGVPLTETTFELFINTPGFYEVFVEPNNGDCPIEGNAIVGIFDIPVANPLTDIEICDDANNDDVFDSFDFTNKNGEALLTQDSNQYNVSYFETLLDAENNQNEITFPYSNSLNPQPIFVRVDNVDNPNCFDINSFQVTVFDTPSLTQLNTIEFCDNEGDPTDGIATIDFNDYIPTLRGTQSASETNITFHLTQDDADNNAFALPLLYTTTDATIFVRLENTLKTDCFNTSSFDIEINEIPIANNVSLIQCDEDGIPEGFTTFNLTEAYGVITDSDPDASVTYYLSQDDAQNDNNAIDPNVFDNFLNPQILYTRVTNTNTGCINFSELSLEVSTTASNNASLSQCDDDGTEDGFASFNLNDANTIVLAGSPAGLDLNYYETYDDALLEINPLGATFTNTVPYNQTIYARVENDNACFGISEIELTVFELPQIETQFETLYCLNNSTETIILDAGLINDLPNNYTFEWSTGETTSTIEVNVPGTYTVRVFNTDGCFKDRTINVLPSNIATITDIEVVDASQNNTITVFVSGEGDYEFALDNINGPYQDSNIFLDVLPGLYTVFVRDKNDCGIVDELVSVIGFPKFFTPNGDDENEFWQVKGISDQFQANSKILIFDRYGKLLIELDPLSTGWDGTYNGATMPASDYWFQVKLQDGRTFTSHFALKR